jgi:4-amino-4-deoxy-L-arabinose transferase-like glycosyltransferase
MGRVRDDKFLRWILLVALAVRLQVAVTHPYVHDEDNTAIPLSKTISFEPGRINLPLRGENHPALSAYVVKAGSSLFGTSRLGYRGMHVLLGLLSVALVFALTRQVFGLVAARWAAALLAFNEFYLNVSARATAQVPTLFLVTVAVYCFSRFLATERARYLYGAAATTGLAFYCKESTGLLVPVFALALLLSPQRRSLLRPHVYLACVLYVAILAPDIAWNLRTDPEKATVDYNDQTHRQATYAAHFRRIGGVGFSPYPSMFYFREPVRWAYLALTGRELVDGTEEYWSVNWAIGLLLVGSVLATMVWPLGPPHARVLLMTMWWGILLFFTLIKKGDPPGRLDPVSWLWVEMTLIPAVVLAGARLGELTGKRRTVVWSLAAVALAAACVRVLATPEL